MRSSAVTTAAFWTLLGAVIAAFSSTVAASSDFADLLCDVTPNLGVCPKERIGATIEALAIDRNVERRLYLQRIGRAPETGEKLDVNGNVFYIRAAVEGFAQEKVRLKWFTYRAETEERLDRLRSSKRYEEVFTPKAPINAEIAQVWVPTPSREGEYFVRFELYQGSVLLAFVDATRFSIVEF